MGGLLKQSTSRTVILGPFVDDADGKTAKTSLTISQADVRLSKNGGTFAQKNDTSSCSHMENGYYSCSLNTTDTNTLGSLDIVVLESGALIVQDSFLIVPANVYDSLVSNTDTLDTTVIALASNVITPASVAADDIFFKEHFGADFYTEIANRTWALAIDSARTGGSIGELIYDHIDGYLYLTAAAVWDKPLTGITTADTIGKLLKDNINATISSRSSLDAAGIRSAVGLASANLDTQLYATNQNMEDIPSWVWSSLTSGAETPGSFGKLLKDNIDAAISSIEGGGGLDAAGVRAAIGLASANLDTQLGLLPTSSEISAEVTADVWNKPTSSLAATGTIGKLLADNINATISSRSSHTAADIWSVATRVLTAATNLTSTGSAITLHSDARVLLAGTTHNNAVIPTVNAVAGAVQSVTNPVTLTSAYDAAKTAAQAGNAMTLASNALTAAALDSGATDEIVAAILGAAVPAAYGAGTVGYLIGTNLDGAIGSLVIPDTTEIRTEIDGAITAFRLNELLYEALGSAPDAASLFGELTEDDSGTRRFTANSLEMGPLGEGASPATIAAEVWNSLLANYQEEGSMGEAMGLAETGGGSDPWATSLPGSYTGTQAGKLLNDILTRANALPLAAAIRTELETESGKLDLAYAAVTSGTLFTNVGAIKTKTDALPADFLEPGDIPTVAQIRAEMDTNSTRLSNIYGTSNNIEEMLQTGSAIDVKLDTILSKTNLIPAAPAAVGNIPTAAAIATQVLGTSVPGAFGAGTLGYLIGTNVNAALSAIKAKTDLLVADIATNATLANTVEGILADAKLNQLLTAPATSPNGSSFLGHLLEAFGGTWRFRESALAAAPGGEAVVDVEEIVSGLLNTPTAEYTGAGTIGKKIHDQANLTSGQVSSAVWGVGPEDYGSVPGTYGWMIDTRISGMLANEAGTGSEEFIYTVTNSLNSQPIEDVIVTVTSDENGEIVIARARTNEDGQATFWLDPGVYFIWREKTGWNFTNPDEEEVTE